LAEPSPGSQSWVTGAGESGGDAMKMQMERDEGVWKERMT